jgi:hypothetical protein
MPKKSQGGEKQMTKTLQIRSSEEFLSVLEETSWAFRQSMAQTLREAFVKYFEENEENLPVESRKKAKELLKKSPEYKEVKRIRD